MLRWINRNTITRVNTSSFQMFHNTWNIYICTIANSINFDFSTTKVSINKNRILLILFEGFYKVLSKLFFVMSNFHTLTTKNITRTNKNWECKFISNSNTFFKSPYALTLWSSNIERFKDFVKLFSIFSSINLFWKCTKDWNVHFIKEVSKLNSCLTTELKNNAVWLFSFNYI